MSRIVVKPTVETLASIALKTGTHLDYHATPIGETPMARESDPFAFAGRLPDGWWQRGEPKDPIDGRAMLRLLDRASSKLPYGRDSKRRRGRDSAQSETPAHEENVIACDEYLPEKSQTLGEWIAELAKDMDMTGGKKLLFDALRGFCERFGNRQFGELADDERSAITSFVRLLSAKEAA